MVLTARLGDDGHSFPASRSHSSVQNHKFPMCDLASKNVVEVSRVSSGIQDSQHRGLNVPPA